MSRNSFSDRKAILMGSYDNSGVDLERMVFDYLYREQMAGKQYVTPLFARNGTDARDFMKPNFPLQGVPIFFYSALQLFKAGFETAAVGNDDTGRLHDKFCKFFKITNQKFVHEGRPDEWSFANTVRKGMSVLDLSDEENTLLVTADSPFVDIDRAANDPDAKKYDAVLALNTKEISGGIFPRGFYVALSYKGEVYFIKEPNIFDLNLKKLEKNRFELDLFNIIFKGRKRHTKNDSQAEMLRTLVSDLNGEGEYVFSKYRALKAALLFGPVNIYKLKQWSERRKAGIVEKEEDMPVFKMKTAQRVAESLLDVPGFKIKIKPCPDPAALIDIDTYLCLYIAENLLSIAPQIYPYYDELQEFKKSVGGKWGCEITDNWISIANERAKRYKLDAHYDQLGVLHQNIFPQWKVKREAELILEYQSKARMENRKK
ncbi:MAG: hypothetical protein V1866_03950 [archaeon]